MSKITVGDQNLIHKHLLSVLGLEALPEGQKTMLLEKMTDVANQRILLKILSVLDEKQKKEFTELMDKDEDSAARDFIAVNVPDFLEITAEEINKLKTEMLAHLKQK